MGKKDCITINGFDYKEIEKFDFGSLEGEKDKLLNVETFIETKSIIELNKRHYNYILSSKGIGKSTIFQAIINKYISKDLLDYSKYVFIPINESFGFNEEYLSEEKFSIEKPDKIYTMSWALYLIHKIISFIREHENDFDYTEDFYKKIKRYEDFKEKYELYNIFDYLNDYSVKLAFIINGINIELKPTISIPSSKIKKIDLSKIFKIISEFFEKNGKNLVLLIDRVDNFVRLPQYEIQKNYICGLINTIEEIDPHNKNISIALFLRTDLFYKFYDMYEFDKIRERVIELKWEKDEILFFILKRMLSIAYIADNYSNYLKYCQMIENKEISNNETIFKKIINLLKNIQPSKKHKKKYNLEKNLNYRVAEKFLKLFLPPKLSEAPDDSMQNIFDSWFFPNFINSNDCVIPRIIIRFFNQLFKNQYKIYASDPPLLTDGKCKFNEENEDFTSNIFMPEVIMTTYENIQNEELFSIYSLLKSDNEKKAFITINSISLSKRTFSYQNIKRKINMNDIDLEKLLKFLRTLGYIKYDINSDVYEIPPLYRKKIIFLN